MFSNQAILCSLVLIGACANGSLDHIDTEDLPFPIPHDDIQGSSTAIVNGAPIPIKWVPWHAQIYRNDNYRCGGTIIDEGWVLTAAHCLTDKGELGVLIASNKNGVGSLRNYRSVKRVIVHPDWRDTTVSIGVGIDIALIELSRPFKLHESEARKIHLMTPEFAAQGVSEGPGKLLAISGFGQRDPEIREFSQDLNFALVTIRDTEEVEQLHGDMMHPDEFAVGGPNGQGACNGDSGGPAVGKGLDEPVLIGVTSWGPDVGCGAPDVSTYYTRVSSHIDWIEAETGLRFR